MKYQCTDFIVDWWYYFNQQNVNISSKEHLSQRVNNSGQIINFTKKIVRYCYIALLITQTGNILYGQISACIYMPDRYSRN